MLLCHSLMIFRRGRPVRARSFSAMACRCISRTPISSICLLTARSIDFHVCFFMSRAAISSTESRRELFVFLPFSIRFTARWFRHSALFAWTGQGVGDAVGVARQGLGIARQRVNHSIGRLHMQRSVARRHSEMVRSNNISKYRARLCRQWRRSSQPGAKSRSCV